jgi:hypothetical protein
MNLLKKTKISALLFFCALGTINSCSTTQSPSANNSAAPTEIWSGCDNCAQPESSYFDPVSKFLFISNVVGDPTKKDQKGSLQKLASNGKMLNANWISGLNAPKGMRSAANKLFVTDIDQIVVINIDSGKIEKKISVKGAKFLNDLALINGVIYVSDTLGSKIYSWDQKSSPKIFLDGAKIEAPNGLLVDGNSLIVAAWGMPEADWSTKIPGHLLKINLKTKAITKITPQPLGNLDGLEKRANGNYLVSDWMAGKVFEVTPTGLATEILNGFKGAADLGWDEETSTLAVPRMNENLISAFRLK